MKRILVTATIAIGVTLGLPAHADIVSDPAAELSLVQQVATAAKELASLQQQYSTVMSQYQMLTTFANPNGVATELENSFLRNPMPTTSTIPGLISGAGNVAGLAQQYLNANRVYSAPTTYQSGQLMNSQANSLASIQGQAAQNLESLEQRMTGLADLQNQLNSATTLQQVASISARIGIEQDFISAQQAQATNFGTTASAQIASQQQAAQQMVSQQAAQTAAMFPVSVP